MAPTKWLRIGLPDRFLVQPAPQDGPRRSRRVWGPSLAENRPKTDPTISGQVFRYPASHQYIDTSYNATRVRTRSGSLSSFDTAPRLLKKGTSPDGNLAGVFVGSADVRPTMAPIPLYIDGARLAVPVATKFSPAADKQTHKDFRSNFGSNFSATSAPFAPACRRHGKNCWRMRRSAKS